MSVLAVFAWLAAIETVAIALWIALRAVVITMAWDAPPELQPLVRAERRRQLRQIRQHRG